MKRRVKNTPPRFTRIDLIFFVVISATALVFVRLLDIQILSHGEYTAMAKSQHSSLHELPAKRGDIISADGYLLATSQVAYLLYAEPKKIENPREVSEKLAIVFSEGDSDLLETYEKYFFDRLSLEDLNWVALQHYIEPVIKERIEDLGFDGLGFEDQTVRYYPEGTLASHVLGFVAKNEAGFEQGYFGVEGEYNLDLQGYPGRVVEERDAYGNPILLGNYRKIPPTDGRTVVLTIDRTVQYLVEKRLKEGVEMFGAYSGSVVVMDPNDGTVIAMANYPTYNPEEFYEEAEESTDSFRPTINKQNLAIAEIYEPGSVIKPITVAAAIDSGKVTPETTFIDSGPTRYSDYVIDNWDGKHHGVQTILQLLQKSNNIGSAWVGHLLGSKNLVDYFSKFGMGQITGIDLEGEDTGDLRSSRLWTDIDLATAAFGQGVSATPLQVLNAFNVFANGGQLLEPRVVEKLSDGTTESVLPTKRLRQVIDSDSAETMVYMLTEAVSGGESKYFNLPGYEIAGKTGTAQIPRGGEYDPDLTNATFVGFLPKSRKFSMIVRLDRPSSSVYAAETAVPLWMAITADLVHYYGIPQDFPIE